MMRLSKGLRVPDLLETDVAGSSCAALGGHAEKKMHLENKTEGPSWSPST